VIFAEWKNIFPMAALVFAVSIAATVAVQAGFAAPLQLCWNSNRMLF
jgi:hypothetical protein